MTSRKKTSGFKFWSCVISAWPWCICPPKFSQIAPSNSELLTFSEIQDCGRHHLGFSSHVNLEHSVMLIVWCLLYIKFGSNIGDSHWDQHLCSRHSFDVASRINLQFRLLVSWLSPHGRDASSHKHWCRYLYPVQSYWHFSEIEDGGRRHLGFSVYMNLAIPACW